MIKISVPTELFQKIVTAPFQTAHTSFIAHLNHNFRQFHNIILKKIKSPRTAVWQTDRYDYFLRNGVKKRFLKFKKLPKLLFRIVQLKIPSDVT